MASGKGSSSVAWARADMQAMPELVQPHPQLGTTGRCLDCLQLHCAGCAAAVRLGKAAGETKPSQLCLAHTSSRGMQRRALETKFVPPPPNLAPLTPTKSSATQTALLPPTSPLLLLPPLELYPLSYKGRSPHAEPLGSYRWNPFPRPCT